MKRFVYILVAVIVFASCGHEDDSHGRDVRPPENSGIDTPSDKYDFSEALKDATSRIESTMLTLRYGEPGVMVSVDNGINYEFRDISTGHYAVLTADGEVEEGEMKNALLEVDGGNVVLSNACIEQVNSQGVWIHLTTSRDSEHIVIVVTDI